MGKRNNSRSAHKSAPPIVGAKDTGVERSISTNKLTSGLPYQRPVDEREVDRLVREWDERLLDPLVVSYREGRFNLIDGQHRVSALRKKNGGRDVMVRCKVYSGLTYEEEAALCWKLDKAKKRLSLSQATNALAESGMDTEITEIKRLMNCEGFTWALGRKYCRDYEVAATRAVINAYRFLGDTDFLRMFRLLGDTWHGDVHSLNAPVISGMALFIKTYGSELNDRTFVKRLSTIAPEEVVRRGRMDFSTSNTALRYARIVLEKYNGSRGGKKLPYRFEC